jgi:ABC-type uncharacterized transport system substrate-binding protein
VGYACAVGSGFIASLARPGGNITGLTNISIDLSAKLMELFAELVPSMKRIGVVHDPSNPAVTVMLRETEPAVQKLNMQVEVVAAQTSDEFERAFAQLSGKSADGVVLLPSPTVSNTAGGSRSLRNRRDCPRPFNVARMSILVASSLMDLT